MGRWAQSRRRGGCAPPAASLPAPPAPDLVVEDGELFQSATGGDDTGGQVRLYTSYNGDPPWVLDSQVAWESVHNWGDISTWDGQYVRATEVGNGVAFSGESEPSAVVHILS